MSSNESNFSELTPELAAVSAKQRERLSKSRESRKVITDFSPLMPTGAPTPKDVMPPAARAASQRAMEVTYAEMLRLVLAGDGGTLQLTPSPTGRLASAAWRGLPFSMPEAIELDSSLQLAPPVLELQLLQVLEQRIARRRAAVGELDFYLDEAEAAGSEPPKLKLG